LRKSGTSSGKSNQNNYFTIVDAAEIVVKFINKENTFFNCKNACKNPCKNEKVLFQGNI